MTEPDVRIWHELPSPITIYCPRCRMVFVGPSEQPHGD